MLRAQRRSSKNSSASSETENQKQKGCNFKAHPLNKKVFHLKTMERANHHASAKNGKPPLPPQLCVTFARRTSSGRYVSYSRDELDSELGSSDFLNYTVQMPPTPDNQPCNPISQKVEEQYVSSSLFTGGFNNITRTHLMDKVIDSDANHPMAGMKECLVRSTDVMER